MITGSKMCPFEAVWNPFCNKPKLYRPASAATLHSLQTSGRCMRSLIVTVRRTDFWPVSCLCWKLRCTRPPIMLSTTHYLMVGKKCWLHITPTTNWESPRVCQDGCLWTAAISCTHCPLYLTVPDQLCGLWYAFRTLHSPGHLENFQMDLAAATGASMCCWKVTLISHWPAVL